MSLMSHEFNEIHHENSRAYREGYLASVTIPILYDLTEILLGNIYLNHGPSLELFK